VTSTAFAFGATMLGASIGPPMVWRNVKTNTETRTLEIRARLKAAPKFTLLNLSLII
jgi:hypothetical protein